MSNGSSQPEDGWSDDASPSPQIPPPTQPATRSRQSSQDDNLNEETDIEKLKKQNKKLEVQLQLARQRYMEDLKSLDETKIIRFLEESDYKEVIQRMKDRISSKDDRIKSLCNELEAEKDRCSYMETKCSKYKKLWKEAQQKVEVQRRAILEQSSRMNYTSSQNNRSTASSFADNHVPSPPIRDISMEEILRGTSTSQDIHSYDNMSAHEEIPPPPPINFQLEDILDEMKEHSS